MTIEKLIEMLAEKANGSTSALGSLSNEYLLLTLTECGRIQGISMGTGTAYRAANRLASEIQTVLLSRLENRKLPPKQQVNLSAEDTEAAAAQIILGEKQEASRKVKDGDLLQEWFDHVITHD